MAKLWIKTRLSEINKTATGLADALGTSHPNISRLINGTREIKSSELPSMSQYLEVPIDLILFNSGYGKGQQSSVEALSNSATFTQARIEFFQKLYEENILIPGKYLDRYTTELSSFCDKETNHMKIGLKIADLIMRARKQKKNEAT